MKSTDLPSLNLFIYGPRFAVETTKILNYCQLRHDLEGDGSKAIAQVNAFYDWLFSDALTATSGLPYDGPFVGQGLPDPRPGAYRILTDWRQSVDRQETPGTYDTEKLTQLQDFISAVQVELGNLKPYVAVTEVTVSPATYSLGVGSVYTLNANVNPGNATVQTGTWKSSNPTAVSVDATGKLTGLAAGTANITYTVDGVVSNACVVTAAVIVPTGVTVNPTTASISIGGTRQITATVAPTNSTNKSVTWSTSAPAVATVSATGLITAVAAGSATITCTTVSGARTATVAVTVPAA